MDFNKPFYELWCKENIEDWFNTIEDAREYGNSNCDEYCIYMKMKIEEKFK